MIKNILLDMDGVLVDFFSSALNELNEAYPEKAITAEDYVKNPEFDLAKKFNITSKEFWDVINRENFWLNLKPFEWYLDLYNHLKTIAEVTILTAPSTDPNCITEKLMWLKKYMDLDIRHCAFTPKKYLMAKPSNVLIDDFPKNTNAFVEHGGKAILLPSNWNTPNLNFDMVMTKIDNHLSSLDMNFFDDYKFFPDHSM